MSDIAKHEFADQIAEFKVNENTDQEKIILDTGGSWYFFDKDDVEAMAIHFNLITEK